MTEDEALVDAVLANPDDRTPRLVLADLLEELGYAEQAEVIRARCSLETMARDHPDRPALQNRDRVLSRRHDWVEQCGLVLTWEQALALFRRRLTETAVWCGRGEGSLRTLAPPPEHLIWQGGWTSESRDRTPTERQAIVNRLANQRARLLADRAVEPSAGAEGRLLVFYPDATLFDGAAEAESQGFFDAENVPAWDTWVWTTEDRFAGDVSSYGSYLVCWVPPERRDRVNGGVAVNPEECIRWAADVDTALTRRLRTAGLLS